MNSSPTGASFDAPFWRNRRRCRRRRSCLLDVATADGGADAAAADDCCCRGCYVVVVGYPKPRESNRYHAPRFSSSTILCLYMRILNVFVSLWCWFFFLLSVETIYTPDEYSPAALWFALQLLLIRTAHSRNHIRHRFRFSKIPSSSVSNPQKVYYINTSNGSLEQLRPARSKHTSIGSTIWKHYFFPKLPPIFSSFSCSHLGERLTGNKKNTPSKFTNTLHRVWIHFSTVGKPTISYNSHLNLLNPPGKHTKKYILIKNLISHQQPATVAENIFRFSCHTDVDDVPNLQRYG